MGFRFRGSRAPRAPWGPLGPPWAPGRASQRIALLAEYPDVGFRFLIFYENPDLGFQFRILGEKQALLLVPAAWAQASTSCPAH